MDSANTGEPPRQLPTYKHLIIPPCGGNSATDDAEVLLAISPGALLRPESFAALAAATQAAALHLRLWVGVINVDFMGLIKFFSDPLLGPPTDPMAAVSNGMRGNDGYNQLLQQVIDQAGIAGFKARVQTSGDVSNMALLCQSAGSLGFASLGARRATVTVLLATVLNIMDHIRGKPLSIETWPRPLMVLGGELDGQMRWPCYAPYIAEMASMATKFGARYTAVTKPVVILPGVNHGNTSNGEARVARGDIAAGLALELGACLQALGTRIAAFLTAHLSPSEEARSEAGSALLDIVRQSTLFTAPYSVELGLGDWSVPFAAGGGATVAPPRRPAAGPYRPGGLVAGVCRIAGAVESSALHPGLLSSAETHAVQLQRHVLAELPAAEMELLDVVATAHTEAGSFQRSEAALSQQPDGRWLLHVHVLLYIRALESDRPYICPNAPEYWLKLKCAELVATLLGLPDPASYSSLPPSTLNSLTLEQALGAAPRDVLARYRARGRQLVFEDDGEATPSAPDGEGPSSAEPSAKAPAALFRYPSSNTSPAGGIPGAPPSAPSESDPSGAVSVVSPFAIMPIPGNVKSLPPAGARLAGSYYTRVLSVAQALEWVWLDCLRATDTPW